MTGLVRESEAWIKVVLLGRGGRRQRIEAVVDTGFNAYLTLPPALIDSLRLPRTSTVRGILADGSESIFDMYEARVLWNRRVLEIPVQEADATPLVGMGLLNGYELKMEVRDRGKVSIRPLRGRRSRPR
jgi:clan AA aspartic protease